MTYIHPVYLEHERKRFMRPDAHRFFCPDWRRYMRAGQERDLLYRHFERIERKYSPDQPRVPQGSPNGGQWTNNGDAGASGRNDPRIISDAAPDSVSPSIQYAQNRPRGGFASVIINGQQVEQHPDSKHVSQSSRRRLGMLFSTCENSTRNGNQHRALMKVSKASSEPIDPMLSKRWKESPNFSKLALARVRSREGQFPREAQSGTSLLQSAVRSIELASRPDAIRTMSPGTPLENFVLDHQPPTAWNPLGSSQRLYPQCFSCSARQGNWISRNGGRR